MDLIYAQFNDGIIEDVNVLQDYSFDEVYGIGENDVNDFVCRVQRYNHKCNIDDVLYIEFTEYGGIIDRIEVDSKSGEIAYKGRTWHGVLNSYVIQPLAGDWARTYSGDVNEILQQMIDEAGIGNIFVADAVPVEDRELEINFFAARYEKMYDAIIRLLKEVHGKLICYFLDGKVHLGAVLCVDYSHDEEFDTGKIPYKVGITENNVNHLICLGKGEDENRAVIHLFTDGGGGKSSIQPYKLIENPLEDSEYILDKRNQIITGKDEITEVLDLPNAEVLTNYKILEQQPADWKTKYHEKYYEDIVDETTRKVKKQLIKVQERDEYRLLTTKPTDWDSGHYTDYFFWDNTKESQDYFVKGTTYFHNKNVNNPVVKIKEGDNHNLSGGAFASVKAASESESHISWDEPWTVETPPPDWDEHYSEYYIPNGTDPDKKEAVSARTYDKYGINDGYNGLPNSLHTWNSADRLQTPPADWGYNFSNYVTRAKNVLNQWIAQPIEGVKVYSYNAINRAKAPSDWSSTWNNYYVNAQKKKFKKGTQIIKIGGNRFISARDALDQKYIPKISNEKNYPAYKKGKFYVLTQTGENAPNFSKLTNGVWEKFSIQDVPLWEYPAKHYYKKVVNSTPNFDNGEYYEKVDDVEQIPNFNTKTYYYAVEDRMKSLVESGIEKLIELSNKSTLELTLELDSNYDVLDRLGVTDDVTGKTVIKDILRKVIRIKRYILSVEYEVE